MLEASLQRILDRLGSDDVVLDIGGWGRPFTRADWVMDLMPYTSRGMLGRDGPAPERFGPETWIQRDICDREPYPFGPKQIDFAICAHTLEDVRDPVWVCDEMVRIAKAGYIEVPSRLEEQAYGFQGPWAGWSHHRWLIDPVPGGLQFVFKHSVVHNRRSDRFPVGFERALTAEDRVVALWWEDSFEYAERVFVTADGLDPYIADFVSANKGRQPFRMHVVGRLAAMRRRMR